MVDAGFLSQLSARAILINAGRGGAIASKDLKQCLHNNPGIHAVLDVWENEPDIDRELVSLSSIATPHIAGYALDGKRRGTAMIATEVHRFFDMQSCVKTDNEIPHLLDCEGQLSIRDMVLRAYDVREDDWRLRSALQETDFGRAFDQLRKTYPARREFSATTLLTDSSLPSESCQLLGALGFTLA